MSNNRIGTRVGVLIFKNGKIMLLKRQGSHGAQTWAPPGGHIEFGESFEDASRRETLEETGMNITNIRIIGVTNDYFKIENRHYVTTWVACDWLDGEAVIMEPEKCLEQRWVPLEELPDNLFVSLKNLLDSPFLVNAKEA